jgi:integrase
MNPQNGPKIASVEDLLARLQGKISTYLVAGFRTAVNHLCRYLQVAPEKLAIEALVDVLPGFRADLEQRDYKRSSVLTYCKSVRMLLVKAEELGWRPLEPEAYGEWQLILEPATKAGLRGVVRYAVRHNIAPWDFSDRDLDAWGETLLAAGRSHTTVCDYKVLFKRVLSKSGLTELLPRLSYPQPPKTYGVSLSRFSAPLRAEVEHLLAWKQADFAPHRPHRCRHRAVTAELLKACIQQLYGFAINIQPTLPSVGGTQPKQPGSINSLVDLVNSDRLTSWVEWRINHRKNLTGSVKGDIGMLYSAMRYYPAFAGHNFTWFSELLPQISETPRSGIDERKLSKYVDYDDLWTIPSMIQEERRKLDGEARKKQALLVRDQLLILWLLILPWRQRNIRECGLGKNLLKAELPPMGGIEIPKWVKAEFRANPRATFWQFHFREWETKNGEQVRAALPRQLIPLLEEYLNHHRPFLLNGSDPGNLFVTRVGNHFTSDAIEYAVQDITVRYLQKRVTPHPVRDIFAYKWLQENPRDYLTLSKHLWHKDIKTTLRIYGARFDTSVAACAVEEWLDSRAQVSGPQPMSATDSSRSDSSAATVRVEEWLDQRGQVPGYAKPQPISASTGGIVSIIQQLLSVEEVFRALPFVAKQRELSKIASVLKAHPLLAKLIAGGSANVPTIVTVAAGTELTAEPKKAVAPKPALLGVRGEFHRKAKPNKPAALKLSPADQGRAARAEGNRRFRRAGNPTPEQYVIVYGKRGPRMTWQERAKVAGLPNAEAAAVGFQAALAAKLAAAG